MNKNETLVMLVKKGLVIDPVDVEVSIPSVDFTSIFSCTDEHVNEALRCEGTYISTEYHGNMTTDLGAILGCTKLTPDDQIKSGYVLIKYDALLELIKKTA